MINHLINTLVDWNIGFWTEVLMPFMTVIFGAGIVARVLIYYTIMREEVFAREFDRRVDSHLEVTRVKDHLSFFSTTKRLLEKTYYEMFEVRALMKRRKPDMVMHWSDRVFLVKQGTAWMVKDLLRHLMYLRYNKDGRPKLLQIAKNSFQRNPCFSKVFGVLPGDLLTDMTNLLPGMFIVGGIFGTFLGIMKALPDLGSMDLSDVQGSKLIMDQFLLKVAFSMNTSILGIILSVVTSLVNTTFSPIKTFVETVDRLESSLDKIWNISTNNDLPKDIPQFDEHKDPIDALAEQAVDMEYAKAQRRNGELSNETKPHVDVDVKQTG